MKDALTPEEKGKKILEQQAQEQRRFQLREEKAEKEERERLRRLKEREGMVFLTYAKMRMEEEKNRQEQEKLFSRFLREFYAQHIQQAMLFNRMMMDSLTRHDAAVSDVVFGGENEKDMEKRNALLQNSDIERSDYCALVVADLCKDPGETEDVEKVFLGTRPSERLMLRRKACLNHTDDALIDFSKGNIKKMEAILREGLLTACHAFSHTKDTLRAMHWSKQINGILSVVTAHPILFKDGPNTPLFEAAVGMAALGRVMENGLKALDELCAFQMKGARLSPEKEQNLQAQILLMQKIDVQRSNEQYRKLFAKGYHPKKGLQQENLDNLLRKLNNSQAMYTLSTMDREQRFFALSDPESRKTLSEDLFVRHTELTMDIAEPEITEPVVEIERPSPRL